MSTSSQETSHTLIEKAVFLKRTALMNSLDLNQLLPIADKLSYSKAAAGEVIFDTGEQGYSLFFLAKGSVLISYLGENSTIHPGDFFGEEALLTGLPRAYKAVAKDPAEMYTLSKTNLLAVLHEHPALAVDLLELFASSRQFRIRNCGKGSFSHGGNL